MPQTIEFIVKGIVQGESTRLRVIGRVTEDSISLGKVFGQLYQTEDEQLPDGSQIARRFNMKNLELRVAGIHAYGRELTELGPGMTGSLDLEGMGAELVAPGWLLGLSQSACEERGKSSSSRAVAQAPNLID